MNANLKLILVLLFLPVLLSGCCSMLTCSDPEPLSDPEVKLLRKAVQTDPYYSMRIGVENEDNEPSSVERDCEFVISGGRIFEEFNYLEQLKGAPDLVVYVRDAPDEYSFTSYITIPLCVLTVGALPAYFTVDNIVEFEIKNPETGRHLDYKFEQTQTHIYGWLAIVFNLFPGWGLACCGGMDFLSDVNALRLSSIFVSNEKEIMGLISHSKQKELKVRMNRKIKYEEQKKKNQIRKHLK